MKNKITLGFYMGMLLCMISCAHLRPENDHSKIPDHVLWDSLVKTHVDSLGLVNYQGFINDSLRLNQYLKELANNAPNNMWTEQEQLAYWINLYNAATIKLITLHYPISSINDIGPIIQIPFVNTPWQKKFIQVGSERYNLDYIEHKVIREFFDEPRIHFALVCAAISCPPLRNESYMAYRLNDQLTEQTVRFLSDSSKNRITKDHLSVSRIFWWYGGDFKKHSTLIEYLNLYCSTEIQVDAKIIYMDYNWQLNKQ